MSGLPTMMPQFSRFHAISSARPVHTDETPILTEPPTYGTWNVRFDSGKRSRQSSDPGPSKPRKVTKRSPVDEENKREPTTRYHNSEGLLTALKNRFKEGPNVDFAGVFDMVDTSVTHKERVQLFVHEIWKTTGYRFTVKDHPQFTNGHKTRFWCSQDEAHRSKSSKAARKSQGDGYKPRVTSAGEVLAKTRFPCRSRLLVSSRDSKTPGFRSITVRMHHHLNHEPYEDTSFPPEVLQTMWDNYEATGFSTVLTGSSRADDAGPGNANFLGEEDGDSSDSDSVSSEERFDDQAIGHIDEQNQLGGPMTFVHHMNHHPPAPSPHQSQLPSHRSDQQQQQHPHPHSHQHQLPPASEKYHNRMKAHIKNLREFCEGLEYQLQFNDYRMLDVLEHEGGAFLSLVADCLKKEGRLATVDQSPNTSTISSSSHHVATMSINAPQHQRIPILSSTPSQRSSLSISTAQSQHPSISISSATSQHTPISLGSAGSQQHNTIPIGSGSSHHPPGYMPLHLISDSPLDNPNRNRTYEGNPGINPRALGY